MKHQGFSLIEILVVLTIIGILVSVEITNYSQLFVEQRRNTAKSALLQLASEMENFYFQHHTYQGADSPVLLALDKSANRHYQFLITEQSAIGFQLAAIPQGQQAQQDLRCGTLLFNSAGEKQISGSGTLSECW